MIGNNYKRIQRNTYALLNYIKNLEEFEEKTKIMDLHNYIMIQDVSSFAKRVESICRGILFRGVLSSLE